MIFHKYIRIFVSVLCFVAWFNYGNGELYCSTYLANWTQANNACSHNGGSLATISQLQSSIYLTFSNDLWAPFIYDKKGNQLCTVITLDVVDVYYRWDMMKYEYGIIYSFELRPCTYEKKYICEEGKHVHIHHNRLSWSSASQCSLWKPSLQGKHSLLAHSWIYLREHQEFWIGYSPRLKWASGQGVVCSTFFMFSDNVIGSYSSSCTREKKFVCYSAMPSKDLTRAGFTQNCFEIRATSTEVVKPIITGREDITTPEMYTTAIVSTPMASSSSSMPTIIAKTTSGRSGINTTPATTKTTTELSGGPPLGESYSKQESEQHNNNKAVIIGSVAGGCGLLLLCVILSIILRCRCANSDTHSGDKSVLLKESKTGHLRAENVYASATTKTEDLYSQVRKSFRQTEVKQQPEFGDCLDGTYSRLGVSSPDFNPEGTANIYDHTVLNQDPALDVTYDSTSNLRTVSAADGIYAHTSYPANENDYSSIKASKEESRKTEGEEDDIYEHTHFENGDKNV